MEVLGGVSSAFAIVSLTVELGGKIKKLCDFWDSVQEAPREIRLISRDLKIISDVLEDIRQEADAELRPHSRAFSASLAALEQCGDNLETLQEIVRAAEPAFASAKWRARNWASFKTAWKGGKLRRFQDELRDMKITLSLARQNTIHRASLAHHESHQQELTYISQGMGFLLQEQSSRTVTTTSNKSTCMNDHVEALKTESERVASSISNPIARYGFQRTINSALAQLSETAEVDEEPADLSTCLSTIRRHPKGVSQPPSTPQTICNKKIYSYSIESLFGTIHVRSNITETMVTSGDEIEGLEFEDTNVETKTSFTVYPSRWLQLCGINYGIRVALSKSFRGMSCGQQTYRAVPDDSLIFKLSERGDVDGIRELFDQKLASPWDTDSYGYTPLILAAHYKFPTTCQFLMAQGADLDATNWRGQSAIHASYSVGPVSYTTYIETMRLFIDHIDDDSATKACENVIWTYLGFSHFLAYKSAFEWAFSMLKDQLIRYLPPTGDSIALLFEAAMCLDDCEPLNQLLPLVENTIADVALPLGTMLAEKVIETPRAAIEFARLLIPRGLDLHQQNRYRRRFGSLTGESNPISVVLVLSRSFLDFRNILLDHAVNILSYIKRELEQPGLRDAGWTEKSLHALFNLRYVPLDVKITCPSCATRYHLDASDNFFGIPPERSWTRMLERLRERDNNGLSIEAILQLRDEEIVEFKEPISGTCFERYCEIGKRNLTRRYNKVEEYNKKKESDWEEKEDEEDSPFLLSIG